MIRWDYLGWKKGGYVHFMNYMPQEEWNQTLMTALNKANALYHVTEAKTGSNIITVNDKLNTLLYSLEFVVDGMYTHRKIVIDNELDDKTIIVGNTEFPNINVEITVLNYDK